MLLMGCIIKNQEKIKTEKRIKLLHNFINNIIHALSIKINTSIKEIKIINHQKKS